jgi:hypothetical protein
MLSGGRVLIVLGEHSSSSSSSLSWSSCRGRVGYGGGSILSRCHSQVSWWWGVSCSSPFLLAIVELGVAVVDGVMATAAAVMLVDDDLDQRPGRLANVRRTGFSWDFVLPADEG